MAGQAVILWSKEVPRLEEGSKHQFKEFSQSRTRAGYKNFRLCDANDPIRSANALVLIQEFRPFPGANPTDGRTLVHQVKETRGELQHLESIHHMKLYPIGHPLSFSLAARERNHFAARIYSDEQGGSWKGLGHRDKPAPGATADIKNSLKRHRKRLLWQHSSHAGSHQLVLDLQAFKLFETAAILYEIGIRIFLRARRFSGCRHRGCS